MCCSISGPSPFWLQWVDYQQLFHFPICCQQSSMHTHVPIINLIYMQLHKSLNKHVNIVYWQNCANNVSLNIMTYLLFYFLVFLNLMYHMKNVQHWPSILHNATNSRTQSQIGNMHLSCSIDPYLDLARKWQVIKYTEVCLVNDYVGLR
jgi:hypothetical protein